MSQIDQIHIDPGLQEPLLQTNEDTMGVSGRIPKELHKARAASGWKIAGRVLLGISTCGLSELFRLAWRGIRSLVKSCSPAPERAPRITAKATGLPRTDPAVDSHNKNLANCVRKGEALPPEYQDAVDMALRDLRDAYGEEMVPQGSLKTALDGRQVRVEGNNVRVVKAIYDAVISSDHMVSPAELANFVRTFSLRSLNRSILIDKATSQMPKDDPMLKGSAMLYAVDTILREADLKALEEGKESIYERLDRISGADDVRELAESINISSKLAQYDTVLKEVVDEMRGLYGQDCLPASHADLLNMQSMDATETLGSRISSFLLDKEEPPCTPAQFKEKFRRVLMPMAAVSAISGQLSAQAQDMGVTLTPRSTLLLAREIIRKPQNQAALAAAKDSDQAAAAIAKMGLASLLQAHEEGRNDVYDRYSGQVDPELKPLLRQFIDGKSFSAQSRQRSEQSVQFMVERMKNWKDLDGTEADMKDLSEDLRGEFNEDLDKLADDPGEQKNFNGDIYETMIVDSNRSDYTVNGTNVPRDPETSARQLTGLLEQHLPAPRDRQYISKLCNQRLWANMQSGMMSGITAGGTQLNTLPGHEKIPAIPMSPTPLLRDDKSVPSSFDIAVSKDGKHATVTASLNQLLCHLEGGHDPFGKVRFTYTMQIDLSGAPGGPSMTGFSYAQKFLPLTGKELA